MRTPRSRCTRDGATGIVCSHTEKAKPEPCPIGSTVHLEGESDNCQALDHELTTSSPFCKVCGQHDPNFMSSAKINEKRPGICDSCWARGFKKIQNSRVEIHEPWIDPDTACWGEEEWPSRVTHCVRLQRREFIHSSSGPDIPTAAQARSSFG